MASTPLTSVRSGLRRSGNNRSDISDVRKAIAAGMADEILELTQAGVNQIAVGDQTYRFVRSSYTPV